MKSLLRGLTGLAVVVWVLGASASPALAQATTGSLSGQLVDENGGALPGASVNAVHTPTGTQYNVTTRPDGRFVIPNVRVGGPYKVTASLSGFNSQEQSDVYVKLGEDRYLSFRLQVASVSETITVTAEAGSIINPASTGTAQNVGAEAIRTLPTVGRGLEDFARLSPYFAPSVVNDGQTSLSVAGRNNRYNNVQIDGAVNNDLFGLAATGTPGGQTEAQPIALDAIQELQLVVSPYDVRQGGFSGGGINAITKSGTNEFHGTAYYYTRSQSLVGKGIDDREISTFSEKIGGASIGGPIVKDKAFFFVNVDLSRKDRPSGVSIDGSSGQAFGHIEEATRFRSILQNVYGYDPGGFEEFTKATDSDKVLAKLDFNINDNHRLTLRHSYVSGSNDVGFPSTSTYNFPDFFYNIRDKTNSTVAQLNSTFGTVYNELRLTYQTIRDNRDGPTEFPRVQVRLPDGTRLTAGRENFSTANRLDQDVIELTDDVTLTRGNHLITIGTHNEFFKFDNLFIRDFFGNYEFSSLDNLEAGLAQSYDHSFSATSDPQQSAQFKVNQFGFYVGDLWHAKPNFTLNFGLRLDFPSFPDTPSANPAAQSVFGYATDTTPSSTLFSPRAGFNWDITGDGDSQVRGGLGLFAGRTPYVWLSNQYGNTGIEFTRVRVFFSNSNQVQFVSDPSAQPTTVGGAATNEVDFIDPDYSFPKVLRTNLAYDRRLPHGIVGTAEFLYSKTLKDIAYSNLNGFPSGQLPDGRPLFTRMDRSYSDVILLSNTDQGYQWSGALKFEQPVRNGLYWTASYLYGRAKSVNDGGSSQAASNWGNQIQPGNPNDPPLSWSNYDIRHRILAAISYEWNLDKVKISPSLFYNGQSGRPWTLVYSNDANGDGRSFNDIAYIPSGPDDVLVTNGTYADLDAFISSEPGLADARGSIPLRNTNRAPWTNQVDFRLAVNVPIRKTSVEIDLDVLNLGNLINKDWGQIEYALFNDIAPIRFEGVDAATGRMIYNIGGLTSSSFQQYNRDDLRSRWQAQLGFRFRF